jgi:hypothetical protein
MTDDYVLTSPDGGVTVLRVVPASDFATVLAQFSLTHFVPVKVAKIDASQLPKASAYRDYRAAWTFDGDAFGYDMEKAKAIHADKIRAARVSRLAALDVEVIRRMEAGVPHDQVVAEKQRLRDATSDPRIAAAKSIDELRAVWF